jgi:hypothetical protein
MSKLSTRSRNALPRRDFAGPGRSYPVPDRTHAINAKSRAQQQYARGNLTKGQRDHIVEKANEAIQHLKG